MSVVYCGLDAGSTGCQVCGQDATGAVVASQRFPTSARNLIDAFAAIPGELHVHLEASTLARWIRGVLKPRVARIVVSHPTENAWIARDPRKSDRRDAFKLADMLRRGAPISEVYYPDDDHRITFKELVQHYEDVTDQESRIKLKIKGQFRQQGVFPKGESVYSRVGRESYLAAITSPLAREAIQQMYQLLDHALTTQAQARRLMLREAKQYPEVALLDGAAGVGEIGACQFVGYIQDPHRFGSKRKLWRYCRLGITQRSSDGKPLGHERLDSAGVGRLKAMSHAAFLGSLRRKDNNLFKRTYEASLARTQNSVHARLTTQRKILAVLRAMWKKGAAYRDDQG